MEKDLDKEANLFIVGMLIFMHIKNSINGIMTRMEKRKKDPLKKLKLTSDSSANTNQHKW